MRRTASSQVLRLLVEKNRFPDRGRSYWCCLLAHHLTLASHGSAGSHFSLLCDLNRRKAHSHKWPRTASSCGFLASDSSTSAISLPRRSRIRRRPAETLIAVRQMDATVLRWGRGFARDMPRTVAGCFAAPRVVFGTARTAENLRHFTGPVFLPAVEASSWRFALFFHSWTDFLSFRVRNALATDSAASAFCSSLAPGSAVIAL